MIYTENYTGQKPMFGTVVGGGAQICLVMYHGPHHELDMELTQQGFGMKRCKC